jgi:hypothetical protein
VRAFANPEEALRRVGVDVFPFWEVGYLPFDY